MLHFAVDVLNVRHIIVCGHYGCGGVHAALTNASFGLIDNWLRHVQDVRNKHAAMLAACATLEQRVNLLCALNVVEQVVNLCQTTIVQHAWLEGKPLAVHGWIYGIADGLLHDLSLQVTSRAALHEQYDIAISQLAASVGRSITAG